MEWNGLRTLSWDEMYLLAKDYYIKNKNMNIPVAYETVEGNIKLGRWVWNMRNEKKHLQLTNTQIKKLKAIDIIG